MNTRSYQWTNPLPWAAERIFIWGGKDKKGHYNVKKGTNGAHADNVTNVLMKHHCRHKVSIYMLSVVVLFCFCLFFSLGELNKTSPPTKKTKQKRSKGPASSWGSGCSLIQSESFLKKILEQMIKNGY